MRRALAHGVAAATILPRAHDEVVEAAIAPDADRHARQLRIAFDGDAVIFGDESERISREQGWKPSAATSARTRANR